MASKDRLLASAGMLAAVLVSGPAWASELARPTESLEQSADPDLTRLSLEELAQIEVTSVSRRPESLARAADSVFVITRDDIRRSGAPNLPEVLRLAPNLNVQRVNAVDYAVSARGFNGFETSNKLLVLLDGRTLYSTLSSGVFWDARMMPLQDIERIEVISGPGGALYGANAVNGVINIVTRPASNTQGLQVDAGAGTEDRTLSVRYGGRLGDRTAWRVYASGFERDDSFAPGGGSANDAASGLRAGGRLDWSGADQQITVQGDVFDNTVAVNEDTLGVQTAVRGGNILGRWTRELRGGTFEAQAFYDRFERDEPGGLETSDTWDIALQHAVARGGTQWVIGGGYRVVESGYRTLPGAPFLDPAERTLTLGNLFAQSQTRLPGDVTLTLGVKVEDSNLTGIQWLPSLRLARTTGSGDLWWASVSRASRTPNRIEQGLTLPGFLEPGDFDAERLTAWEAGYRARPMDRLTLSVSVFLHDYDDLRTVSATPVTVLPFQLTNFGRGHSYGLEAWGGYQVSPTWRLSAGLSTLSKSFEVRPDGGDRTFLNSTGDDPSHQLLVQSQHELTDSLSLDLRLRAVDGLETVPAYEELDVRLAWQVTERLELAVNGQNLLNSRRQEAGDPARARVFGRGVYATLSVGF
jgi:iron complex outermembrane recepter protein